MLRKEVEPPRVVNLKDVKPISPFPKGGAIDFVLLSEKTVGAKNAVLGVFMACPGQSSWWHVHPAEVKPGIPQEDLFYIVRGGGNDVL